MSGHTHLKLINSISATAVTLAVSAILIPLWGLIGAAIAALITIVITNFLPLFEVFFLFRFLPYNLSFLKPLLAGLIMGGVGWGMHRMFGDELNIIFLAACVAVLLLVYVGIIVSLGISQEDRIILGRIRQRVRSQFSS
jgi:O-antigen/teichoic acid export membrane protein